MKIISFKAKNELENYAASMVLNEVKKKPNIVLGLATGRTMVGVYEKLVQKAQVDLISFKEVKTFNLDEYVGLSTSHPASFHFYMQTKLFSHLNFNPALCKIPRGNVPNIEAEALRYEHEIDQAGGIDFQLLGLGANAHIGFNEPGSAFLSRTRVVALSDETKAQNQFSFPDESMPDSAISMGLATILRAKKILLIVTGESKANPMSLMLKEMSERVPASLLQKHPDVTILADEPALSLLPEVTRKIVAHGDHTLP